MSYAVKKSIFDIKPYVPGKPIEEVKRELGLQRVIKLASNENPYGPSPKVLKAINQAAKSLNRYPDGDCFYLRQALARHLKVDSRELIFGNGSDEIIIFCARAFLQVGDEVVLAKPSFLIYEIASQLEGAVLKAIPLKDFRYDLAAMKAAVNPKTKIIFLGNPDNPAGTYFTQKDLEGFLKDIPSHVLVFIDEAYYEYVDAPDYADSLLLVKKYRNVIVTRTFSKMYGLAGLRIGYGIACKELIDILNRLREPFNINSLAQVAALACLNDQAYYRQVAKKIQKQKALVYKGLEKLKIPFEPSFTNFILVKVNGRSTDLANRLLKKGIIIRDMAHWGLENYIRVTIGTEEENKKFMNALEALI
jgi:histidinol-phosphate aminotransferase